MPFTVQTNRAGQQTQAPPTIFFKHSRFRLLIHDRYFVSL